MDNARFNQLLALAKEGDTAAIADLFHEFQFDFYSDALPSSISEDKRSSADKKSSDGESV